MIGVLPLYLGGQSDISILSQTPSYHVVPRLVGFCTNIGDGLQNHTCHVQIGTIFLRFRDESVYDYLCYAGNVAKSARSGEEPQFFTLTTRWSQRSVLEVRRVSGPFSQAAGFYRSPITWGKVLVGKGQEIGGNCGLVSLLETGEAEGSWLEDS